MSEKLVQVDLGQEGRDYIIKDRLDLSGWLASFAEKEILAKGRVFTYFPSNVPLAAAKKFPYSKGKSYLKNSYFLFSQYLEDKYGKNNFDIISCDLWIKPEDSKVQEKDKRFFYGNEVYHIPQYQTTFDKINFGGAISVLSFTLLFVIYPRIPMPIAESQVDLGTLKNIATRIVSVMVDAYDDDGVVIWDKQA